MRIVFVTSLLFAFSLASCTSSPSSEPIPAIVTVSATATETSAPMPTFTLEPIATVTPLPIPDFMNEYIERGLEEQSNNDVLYLVFDETKIHYSPLSGIVYKERTIRSWYEVDYIQNGKWKHSIVLGFVRRGGGGTNQDFTKIIAANSGSNIANPSVAFVESYDQSWTSRTLGDHSIFRCLLGLNSTPEMPLQPGVELLFEEVFPVVDKKAQSITIGGIGEVLPATQCEYEK